MNKVQLPLTSKFTDRNRAGKIGALAACLLFTLMVGCHRSASDNPEENNPTTTPAEQTTTVKPTALPTPPQPEAFADSALAVKTQVLAKRFHEAEQRTIAATGAPVPSYLFPTPVMNTESYDALRENGFTSTLNDQLSTFSIDVDTASYANIRRFLQAGHLPPTGAVRIEEMINYFDYSLPAPGSEPFALSAELGQAPWNREHNLLKISLKAQEMEAKDLPPSNLVFLIDVSGSMSQPNKLPLLQKSLAMLVDQLTAQDRLAIVTYAGSDRIALYPTPGDRKQDIRRAIDTLVSGGSTHASSGIHTAYQLAEQVYMPAGNNRVILASDGDFNVGVTSRGELKELIGKKKESGIFLTVLGFGMGNYADDTLELLADSGNGNYAYIDSLLEAKKVLIKERASTLFTLARDVKLQVEFNPEVVGAYRLLGYENRLLADEDFNDDTKDAGEVGLGHTVTALYELIPAGSAEIPRVDQLKYRPTGHSTSPVTTRGSGGYQDEAATIKLRYILPKNTSSVKKELVVNNQPRSLETSSNDFRFSASVAGFGMLLKKSPYAGNTSYKELIELARGSRGPDEEGYRAEFIRLLETASLLQPAS